MQATRRFTFRLARRNVNIHLVSFRLAKRNMRAAWRKKIENIAAAASAAAESVTNTYWRKDAFAEAT